MPTINKDDNVPANTQDSGRSPAANEPLDATSVAAEKDQTKVGFTPPHSKDESSQQNWPVVKSPRFLSGWEETVTRLDVGSRTAQKPKFSERNLAALPLNLHGSSGLYRGVQRLGNFPHLVAALKIAINGELFRNDVGGPGPAVALLIRHASSLFTTMLRQGTYRLDR